MSQAKTITMTVGKPQVSVVRPNKVILHMDGKTLPIYGEPWVLEELKRQVEK